MNNLKKYWPLLLLLFIAVGVGIFYQSTPPATPLKVSQSETPVTVAESQPPTTVLEALAPLKISGLKSQWSTAELAMRLHFKSSIHLDKIELSLKNNSLDKKWVGTKTIILDHLPPGDYQVLATGYSDERKVAQSQLLNLRVIPEMKAPTIPKSKQKIYL